MKKVIYNRFNKAWLEDLPRVVYNGKIIVVTSPNEAEKAVDYLLSMSILGVDTETRPSFTKNQHYKCSLLQVATHHNCFLFRLNYLGMSPAIIRLLEDTKVPKVGLSWHDDIHSLQELSKFTPGWERDVLSEKQTMYAAIDAWACIRLYEELVSLKTSGEYELID